MILLTNFNYSDYFNEQNKQNIRKKLFKNSLKEIYKEIDKLEKTDVEEFKFYNYEEKYRPLAIFAGMLLLMEFLLRVTIFRSFV